MNTVESTVLARNRCSEQTVFGTTFRANTMNVPAGPPAGRLITNKDLLFPSEQMFVVEYYKSWTC